MVVSRIIGGLGNQMFQYAAGLSLALDLGTEFRIDTLGFSTYDLWDFELNRLNIHAEYANEEIMSKDFEHYVDDNKGYHKISFDSKNNIYLNGYFQYENYFSKYKDVIRDEFKLIANLSNNCSKWKDIIVKSVCPISIVTRRGDYLLDTEYFGVCTSGYYNYCIKDLIKKYENCQFYVFTDDLIWAKENINFIGKECYYVDDVESSPEKMKLISLCKHHILANSTFAWWGAWLCIYENKDVYVPTPWFDGSTLDSTIDEWIRINKYCSNDT